MISASRLVRSAFAEARDNAERAIDEILQSYSGDTLGSYFSSAPAIRLYWIVLWLSASRLRVPIEDLAVVVLTHEYAHAFTHVGKDGGGKGWHTKQFQAADTRIKEGLAQAYTAEFCDWLNKTDGNAGPKVAFERLLARQSEPYKVHASWASGADNREECIQRALIQARLIDIRDYDQFVQAIRDAEKVIGRHRPSTRPRTASIF